MNSELHALVALASALGLAVVTVAPGDHSRLEAGSRPTTIIELRQYMLRPGQRDVLIELFEREFVESQEALGMAIVGTFRDLDKPDRFVWIRGFPDMKVRLTALKAFYEGPVWQTHRQAANATMLDNDNVLLLHASQPGSEFAHTVLGRAPKGSSELPEGLVVATIYYFARPVGREFLDFFANEVKPALEHAGMRVCASYVTENTANNFPRLPVREHENVFVWFSVFPGGEEYKASLSRLSAFAGWSAAAETLQRQLAADAELLRLAPTARSALHQ